MDDRFDYERDFYSWSQQQAERLRDLAVTHRDLPNDLDIENIAEEIESVGRSELAAVASRLSNILIHLVKLAALADDARPASHWRGEIIGWCAELEFHFSPGMRQNLDFDKLWRKACGTAVAQLKTHGDPAPILPNDAPFNLDDFLSDEIDIEALVARLRSPSA